MQKDNSTFEHKVALRRVAVKRAGVGALVLETHGGFGRIYERVYDRLAGVVIEKDDKKAKHLAQQRPTWRVYQRDCGKALGAGLAADLAFSVIDLDPYGSPFDVLEAIFCGEPRNLAPRLQLVVNDGLRNKVKVGGAWHTARLKPIVARWGNDLYPVYLDVARELVREIVGAAGFKVAEWGGYYCGANGDMTHYLATLERSR